MPRRPRKEIDQKGAIFHIVCRGNNQRRIFLSSRDYKKFLKIVEEAKQEFPFCLYSYNLLPNHFHLEIETIEASVSKIMHFINNRYVKYFNRRYKRSGHLFQDRFYCSHIDKESYFWEVAQYIDLNATKAGLAKQPQDYQWSSYQFYCQKEYNGKLIDRERFLRFGGDDSIERLRQDYINFVEEALKLLKEKKLKEPSWLKSEKFD